MLEKLLDDHQLFHSKFQQDQLITARAGGTVYGQYKQALRELYKRVRGYREDTASRDLLLVDIEELEWQLFNKKLDQFDRKRKEIELRRKNAQLEESERLVKETAREGARFYQQAVALKEMVGELTPKKRDCLDREMWKHKIKKMAMIDYMTAGRLGVNTLEFALSLAGQDRLEVEALIMNPEKLKLEIGKETSVMAATMDRVASKIENGNQTEFKQIMEEKNG